MAIPQLEGFIDVKPNPPSVAKLDANGIPILEGFVNANLDGTPKVVPKEPDIPGFVDATPQGQPIAPIVDKPVEQTWGSYLTGAGDSLANSVSMNWGDEIGAAANAGYDQLMGNTPPGETFGQTYDMWKESINTRQDAFSQQNPMTSIGTGVLGAIPSTILTAGAANPVVTQTVLGGIEGFGSGKGLADSYQTAMRSAAVALGFSKVGDMVGYAVQKPTTKRVLAAIDQKAENMKDALIRDRDIYISDVAEIVPDLTDDPRAYHNAILQEFNDRIASVNKTQAANIMDETVGFMPKAPINTPFGQAASSIWNIPKAFSRGIPGVTDQGVAEIGGVIGRQDAIQQGMNNLSNTLIGTLPTVQEAEDYVLGINP